MTNGSKVLIDLTNTYLTCLTYSVDTLTSYAFLCKAVNQQCCTWVGFSKVFDSITLDTDLF